jgi:hypothetical protein
MSGRIAVLGDLARAMGAPETTNAGLLLVASVGILITLTQLVLLRRQLKLDALIKITDSNRAIVAMGIAHPQFLPPWGSSASAGSPGEAGSGERDLRRRYLQLWINHMQLMWGAWRLGVISREEWNAYRLDMADLLRLPASRDHWDRVARFYPKGFRRFVAELRQRDEASSPLEEKGGIV